MINPTVKDIGRGVIYRANYRESHPEEGVITDFNRLAVFVRYSNSGTSRATSREALVWLNGTDSIPDDRSGDLSEREEVG